MTFTTLAYIHQLLVENEQNLQEAKELALQKRYEAEAQGVSDEELLAVCEAYADIHKAWVEASNHLREFRTHQFK